MDLYNLHRIELTDNYVTNVDKILDEVYNHPLEAFKSRGGGEKSNLYEFSTMCGRGASMYTMMYSSFSDRLKNLCVETVNFGKFPKPTEVAINRYLPGSYLGKHKDGTGRYWKFQLIFLTSTKPHFTWYDRDDNPHLVEEVPGRCVEMPLHIAHESTTLELDEEDKYSMVFVWK